MTALGDWIISLALELAQRQRTNTVDQPLDVDLPLMIAALMEIEAASGAGISISENGNLLSASATSLDITGSGISGSAVGDAVTIVATGEAIPELPIIVSNGRLTLTSGVPLLTADVIDSDHLFFTPYNGNKIAIWNGSEIEYHTFSEIDLDITPLAADTVHDIWGWMNGASFNILAVAWSDATTRAETYHTTVTGFPTNDSAIASGPAADFGTLLGTIATDGNGQLNMMFAPAAGAGGASTRLDVCNLYNDVAVAANNADSNTGTYKGTAFQAKNNSAANEITFVQCIAGKEMVSTNIQLENISATTTVVNVSIGLDSTTTKHAAARSSNSQPASNAHAISFAQLRIPAPQGRHFVCPLEQGTNGVGNVTWQAAGGTGFQYVCGISLELRM